VDTISGSINGKLYGKHLWKAFMETLWNSLMEILNGGKSWLTSIFRHGDTVVELDALPPDELERIITIAIEDLIDEDAWNAEIEKAKQEREEVQHRIEELLDQIE